MNEIDLNHKFLKPDTLASLNKDARCRNCNKRDGMLCEVLTCEELDRLDAIMSRVEFSTGQTIFTEGDSLDHYFNITDGVVRIIRIMPDGRRAVLDFLYQGDFLGLNTKGQYAYSAEAITPVKLCCFPRVKLQSMFKEIPKMESRLLGMYTDKLVSSQQQQSDLARKSPRERLATFLLGLIQKKGLKKDENTFDLPMSREDISDFLGLTIETISRTLTSFVKEGLITMQKRRTVELKNIPEIKKLAEGS